MHGEMLIGTGSWATSRNRSRWQELWARLSAWARPNEAIEMCLQRYGYQPQHFRWHGIVMRVGHIERVWEEVKKQHARRYFQVICRNGRSYVVFQDLRLGVWYMQR